MRGINGFDVCERIVANRPELPVIVLTAFGQPAERPSPRSARAPTTSWRSRCDLDALAVALDRAVRHRRLTEEV
jgi:two-component system response regulator AtoC